MKEISIIQLTLPNGDLVLQRRAEDIKINPGLLSFFGGHIEDGETADDAMKRELSEETSLNVSKLNIDYFASKEFVDPENPKVIDVKAHLYKTTIDDDNFEVYEGQRAETYSLTDLKTRQDLASATKFFVDHFVAVE